MDFSGAIFAEAAIGFVPYVNDAPMTAGIGVRVAGIHEVLARIGYMPTGDDIGHAFGVAEYRVALRPGRWLRPILGGYLAGLPATCGHEKGRPSCTPDHIFIISATVGVRLEPRPWIGFSALLSLGMDTFPNPFGMIEVATTFALPLL